MLALTRFTASTSPRRAGKSRRGRSAARTSNLETRSRSLSRDQQRRTCTCRQQDPEPSTSRVSLRPREQLLSSRRPQGIQTLASARLLSRPSSRKRQQAMHSLPRSSKRRSLHILDRCKTCVLQTSQWATHPPLTARQLTITTSSPTLDRATQSTGRLSETAFKGTECLTMTSAETLSITSRLRKMSTTLMTWAKQSSLS